MIQHLLLDFSLFLCYKDMQKMIEMTQLDGYFGTKWLTIRQTRGFWESKLFEFFCSGLREFLKV